jgi:hypothetical protein
MPQYRPAPSMTMPPLTFARFRHYGPLAWMLQLDGYPGAPRHCGAW